MRERVLIIHGIATLCSCLSITSNIDDEVDVQMVTNQHVVSVCADHEGAIIVRTRSGALFIAHILATPLDASLVDLALLQIGPPAAHIGRDECLTLFREMSECPAVCNFFFAEHNDDADEDGVKDTDEVDVDADGISDEIEAAVKKFADAASPGDWFAEELATICDINEGKINFASDTHDPRFDSFLRSTLCVDTVDTGSCPSNGGCDQAPLKFASLFSKAAASRVHARPTLGSCGDRQIQIQETCDDGNLQSGDGCSS